MSRTIALAVLAAGMALTSQEASAQLAASREEQTVQTASAVLNEIMAVQVTKIPQYMLADAQGVAIVPNVLKGGFVVGLRYGRGVVLVRDEQGGWQAPQFVSLTGGSFGWQAGVQATDVILVFKTQKSVQNLMRGKFTLGMDAAAAAGPVGREAQAATDATLKAEIYSYSRSRGLFAGVSLDGSALQIEPEANQSYYRAAAVAPGAADVPRIPASAAKLMATLAQYASGAQPVLIEAGPTPTPAIPPQPQPQPIPIAPAVAGPEVLKTQLTEASRRLSLIVDDAWRSYLALPAEVFSPAAQPSAESLAATLGRYERVAKDARYRSLAERAEFRTTHELLERYEQTLKATSLLPALPPPPKD
jgi:lipid-binding SYLF domain-containing protein